MEPSVYIVLVNYNCAQETIECVQSLLQLDYHNYHVLVVDNGSTEQADLEGKIDYPAVTYVKCSDNLGFAGANNVGIKMALEAGAEAIWMLNNDTTVTAESLGSMVTALYRDKRTGMVCPKIMYYDNPDTIWFAGGKLSWYKGNTEHIGQFQSKHIQQPDEMNVNFGTGCSLLIKREVFDRVGMLTDDYFLYFEDTDFCCRVLKAGYDIKYMSKIEIYHKVSASTSTNGIKVYYMTRNNLLFMWRNVNKIVFFVFILFFIRRNQTYIKHLFSAKTPKAKEDAKLFALGCRHFLQGKKGKYDTRSSSLDNYKPKKKEKAAL